MNFSNGVLLGSQAPRYRTVPQGAVSSWGPEAIDLAASAGITLDPGQADIVTDGMSEGADGLWLASEVVDNEPRQNGKTLTLEVRALAGVYLVKEPLVVWTAHEFKTAKRSFEGLRDRIDNFDHLRKRVKAIRNSGATTEIELFNPKRTIVFLARSGGSGRGFAGVAPLFLDEAYALTPEQIAALIYVMRAAKNPQVWYMSSAPLPQSEVLRELCIRGRKGSSDLIYYEWSVPGKVKDLASLVAANKKLSDEEAETSHGQELRSQLFEKTALSNRAFGTRITRRSVLRDLRASGVEQFIRESWGVWSELEEGGRIDPERWAELADGASRRDGEVALAVDISIERDWCAIGMYGRREDGLGHVQLIYYEQGTAGLIEKLRELREVLNPIAIGMARGTHASLKEKLRQAGFIRPQDRSKEETLSIATEDDPHPPQRGDLIVLNGTDMAAACGGFIDSVKHGTMRHVPADQLTDATKVAQTRVVGDSMAWVRTDRSVDITGLVACTEAPWVYEARIDVVPVDEYDPASDLF